MSNFVIDFMRDSFLGYQMHRIDTSPGLDSFARWLVDGIGSAAEQEDVYLQLCMCQPSDLLLALHAPRVTQVRASQDYAQVHEQSPPQLDLHVSDKLLVITADAEVGTLERRRC